VPRKPPASREEIGVAGEPSEWVEMTSHDFKPEATAFVPLLRAADLLRTPAIASAIDALDLPVGSHGLDAGCGIGSHLELLLQAISPGGRLTALDNAPGHLAIALEAASLRGLSDKVSFRQGDVRDLPFEPNAFDWAWSVDCVGLIPGNPENMVRDLTRVVRPGGTVALLIWSSQQLLPGYPFLEARLNGTRAGAAPAAVDWSPSRHPLRSIGWLSRAGLTQLNARTFVVDLRAPLREDQKRALSSLLEMRWGIPTQELSKGEIDLFLRLRDRGHPDSIVDASDYFGFFTYSLFWGVVPDRGALCAQKESHERRHPLETGAPSRASLVDPAGRVVSGVWPQSRGQSRASEPCTLLDRHLGAISPKPAAVAGKVSASACAQRAGSLRSN